MLDSFEIVGLIAATLTTSSFIPQVYKTWKTKSADSLSLTMYTVFLTGVILWLIYGIHLNSLAMIVSNIVTALLTLLLIIFIFLYKK